VIRTIDVSNEDFCELQCYQEPDCVSYNFNKNEEANGQHKCDLNNVTYEHDNEQSGDLAKSENYVYRGAEVNIQPVKVFNLYSKAFCQFFSWGLFLAGFTNVRQREVSCVQNCRIEVPICHLGLNTRKMVSLTFVFLNQIIISHY